MRNVFRCARLPKGIHSSWMLMGFSSIPPVRNSPFFWYGSKHVMSNTKLYKIYKLWFAGCVWYLSMEDGIPVVSRRFGSAQPRSHAKPKEKTLRRSFDPSTRPCNRNSLASLGYPKFDPCQYHPISNIKKSMTDRDRTNEKSMKWNLWTTVKWWGYSL